MLPGSVVAMARSARPIAPRSARATTAACAPRRRYAGTVDVPKIPSTPSLMMLPAAPAGVPSTHAR
jgi:hypothetical protein